MKNIIRIFFFISYPLILLLFSFSGCAIKDNALGIRSMETENQILEIINHRFDSSLYHPGEKVSLSFEIVNHFEDSLSIKIEIFLTYLSEMIQQYDSDIVLKPGNNFHDVLLSPPATAPRGYGVDICVSTKKNNSKICMSTGFDVLENWTQTPRYGFLSDFFPERDNISDTVDSLVRFHLNGIQFYDWMYRHELFLIKEDPYCDLLGRTLSRETIEQFIQSIHEKNIAAMPYSAIYAASTEFYEKHPEWALYQANKKPYLLGKDFLVYMDPRSGLPWANHLLNQFHEVLNTLNFDGIHLDQYGDPKNGYDFSGYKFSLAEALADTINETKKVVQEHKENGTVVFNAVTNWPIETVAKSDVDFIYIEVWFPYTWFSDLSNLIVQAQELSGGKPVILAAYIDPSFIHNVLLMDAVIFANGGGHIELGEEGGMLSDAYFPKYQKISDELQTQLIRYYEFAIRYQDFIGPRAWSNTHYNFGGIFIDGSSSNPSQVVNHIWPVLRESESTTSINLVNFSGINNPEWSHEIITPPNVHENILIELKNIKKEPKEILYSSPDNALYSLEGIDFKILERNGKQILQFIVPKLAYWDLIVITWE